MKKVLALLLVVAFVFTVAAPSFAAAKKVAVKKVVKKVVAKKAAPSLEAQLKTLQAKLAKTKVKATKASLQKQIAALKAKIAAQKVAIAPPPPPPPVAVPPPPPPVRAAPPAPAPTGLFGMGLQTAVEGGLVAGMLGVSGNLLLADPMGLGAMVGLPANSVMYKLGVGIASGNDMNSKTWKALPITLGGVIMLPADMMGGIESFVGGGINYVVYRTGQTSGSLGGDIYVGMQGDLGLGGKTYGQVGYSILRTGTSDKGAYSSKSVSVQVGQKILL
ncbi:MAG: hypothetical protein WC624_04120 [Candidatus Margulisiibacteriota bacterium]